MHRVRKEKADFVYRYLRQFIEQNKFSASDKLPSEIFLCGRLSVCRHTVREATGRLASEGFIVSKRGSGSCFIREKAIEDPYIEDTSRLQIALLIQGQDREASEGFVQSIRRTLKPYNVELRVFFTDNKIANERSCLEACMQGFNGLIVDGVKASFMSPNLDCYARLYAQSIPFAFYNNYYSGTKYPRITIDDEGCADLLVKELADKGHTRIAGIFLCDNYQGCKKYQGFAKALLKYHAAFDDKYIKWMISDDLEDHEQIKRLISRFLRSIPDCTAIACCNIMFYETLLEVMNEMHKSVPRDYSVVCFDYSKSDWETAPVTCSVHPRDEIGKVSAQLLMNMILDSHYKNKEYSYIFPPRIHYGSSVRTLI